MTFWSSRRILLRLSAVAVLLIVIRLLTHTNIGTELFSLPYRHGPGYLVLSPNRQDPLKDANGNEGPGGHVDAGDANIDGSLEGEDQTETHAVVSSPLFDLNIIPEHMRLIATSYVKTILDPSDSTFTGLRCPRGNTKRYGHLQAPQDERRLKYFFALDLRQVVVLLPRLLGSVVEAMRFLGPQSCAISIVEGNSDDGTWEVLQVLERELQALGVSVFFSKQSIDPAKDDRIGNLARLRSLALEPLRNSRNETAQMLGLPGSTLRYSDDATVVFLNDVAACPEDIFELLHQRLVQEADMTCAMDWNHPGGKNGHPLFYDIWISRALSGDLFFDIPANGSWDSAETLFPFDPDSRARFDHHRPFQVFACWNGAVTFTAKPILNHEIDFRRVYKGECFQGEPQTFSKDMWFHGYGRIAVVPSVNLEYTDEKGTWIKEEKGFVYQWVAEEHDEVEGAPPLLIDWKPPPDMVKCMPQFTVQDWRPWNESLLQPGQRGPPGGV